MISVILTTYNRPAMTCEAIDSVLAQTHGDFEAIVVDDGSTDDTQGVLARYGDRIRMIRKENGGVASARNVGLEAARGELIAFLDDDDLWLPEKLEVQEAYHRRHPEVGLIYTDCLRFDERGPAPDPSGRRPRSGWVFRAFVEEYFIIFSTLVVPRAVIERVGHFDEEYLRGDDVDFMGRALEHFPAGYIDRKLIRRRKYVRPRTPAEVRLSGTEQLLYVRKFQERYADRGLLPYRWAARKTARAELKIARACEMLGDAPGAREHCRRAICADPLHLRAYRRWLQAPLRARRSHGAAAPSSGPP
ncbi:MAG: glycosyltransferase family 2 protein [Myxococcales bacterium]|nr:glycosyltransferase family 2 protein [Myxococcales bacterium]MDH5307002.1 glycosyltransferase family 2 protein [Myxococcales bacterium]MDH5566719.1 glycosyltransferase family 2 protein [Myxococcales bacterium]